jgi:hypothetical protein
MELSTVSFVRNQRFQPNHARRSRIGVEDQGFTCIHCKLYVQTAPIIAGVQNRNHCPVCLWSRHLDWRVAGDRLAACRAPMEPIGLTTKHTRNKYARERDGELMLIHRCTACEVVVINRIAGDDSPASLLEVFDAFCSAADHTDAKLSSPEISILTAEDRRLVQRRLFGHTPLDVVPTITIGLEG